MAVRISGLHTFAAPREAVWQVLIDPVRLARALPGCEKLEPLGDNRYHGELAIKIGPVEGRFAGTVSLLDQVPPESYRLEMDGKGASGFVQGKGVIRLGDNGTGTDLSYEVEAQVGGRVATVGQRLLESSAKVVARQALEELDRLLPAPAAAAGSGAAAPAAEPPPPSSQAALAAGFAKGLFAELVPRPWRPVVILAALAVLALVVFLLVRLLS
ncbi:MAG TPA: carbon monoxide dehydrogenase subunit G [Thermoanaerobaculia bacterium]|nr:carbon monoxide dehydrogenase subunit G [Thermoanaerobaculia bacterium]